MLRKTIVKHISVAVAILLLLAGTSAAEGAIDPLWYLVRGGVNSDESWWVDADSAGNIYWATHQTVPGPLSDIFLYKFSPDGSEMWNRRWGGVWNEQAYVVTVADSLVLVGGTKWTGIWTNSCDMAMICWTTAGDSLWDLTWDGGFGYEELDGLVVDGDTIYAAGWTTGETTGNDLAVLKLDRQGRLTGSRTWGTPFWDEANGQIVVGPQYVYVAGRYNAPSELTGGDAVLAAFDKHTLEYAWHQTWGGMELDDAYGMIDDGEHLYLVGLTLSFGGSHIFLLKYDLDGTLLWDTIWGGTGAESSRSLDVSDAGDVLVAGKTTAYGQGEHDIVLLRYTADDSLLWFQTWGGPEIETAHGIVIDGPYAYIAGETYSFGQGKNDALLIKASIDGQFPATPVIEEGRSPNPQPAHPAAFRLEQNYPNPFNASTIIPITLTRRARVTVKIFDILGREVDRLVDGELPAGEHRLRFQADDLPSGVYLCRLQAEGGFQTRRLVLLR
jgi:hypothetical protein